MADAAEKSFVETFQRSKEVLPGADLDWLGHRRVAAVEAFAEAGLPHRRVEAWKYTDLARALTRTRFAPAEPHTGALMLPDAAEAPVAALFAGLDRYVAVIVNGFLRPELSQLDGLPNGAVIEPLAQAVGQSWAKPLLDTERTGDAVAALNTALMRDGVALRLAPGVALDKPLHLMVVNDAEVAKAAHVRNLIRLEEGAAATVLETHLGVGQPFFTDLATDISLADGASLAHLRAQDETGASLHISTVNAKLERGARYESFTLTLGGGLTRNQTFAELGGEGAHAGLFGAYALRENEHCDTTGIVDHAVPHCTSDTLFKGVLDGAATGVFQGKVIVRPDAQKTDAKQMTNALLLSRDAAMNAKPELEIYADDVQCAHGSTVGELDHGALFYLMSRGIPEARARALLIAAFLGEALERVADDTLRAPLAALADGWFREARG